MTSRPVVDVAVGVLIRPDGRFLLASRPEGKPYAHYWEFPGGKLEPGETVATALARELHEELGVEITAVNPWVVREFEYPHAHVRLHFCRVVDWQGEPHAREGQAFRFCSLDDLPAGPLLPATMPVLRWLDLAPHYAITDAAGMGFAEFMRRLEHQPERGLRLALFREPDLDRPRAEPIFRGTLARVRACGAHLLVSSRHPSEWATVADGVHLTSRDLAACPRRPDAPWVCASTHDAAQLRRAASLGADFAVLGPLLKTESHPDEPGMGWSAFASIAACTSIPVYAIGGLSPKDLARAQSLGAHGIASQRSAWTGD